MRGHGVFAIAVLVVAAAVTGCARSHAAHVVTGPVAAPAAHRHAPAPANPDLATVMERFYQQVEGAHWPFAYAMLSPRYRASLSEERFVALYDRYADLDVSLRQNGDRVVVATVGAKERGGAARADRFEETTTLAWDGEDWKIARIARRGVKPVGTR